MQTSAFWLHYPDGSVTKEIRAGISPDAYLLEASESKAYWISFQVSSQMLTYKQAETHVVHVIIDHKFCTLPHFICLWHLMKKRKEIDKLYKQLNLPPLPIAMYWTARIPGVDACMGYMFSDKTGIRRFHCDGTQPVAYAIPILSVKFPCEVTQSYFRQA